ncbi:hypothetical protein [Simiduia curdlanivorans]|uniref:hypothetical protein n=1 Tax=Simiduia curdlanivorans TaxID=1492769 RepID=UPI0033904564
MTSSTPDTHQSADSSADLTHLANQSTITNGGADTDPQTPKTKKDLSILLDLWPFLKPYGWNLVGAAVALVFTAGTTLVLGQGVKLLIDEGFVGASTTQLNKRCCLSLPSPHLWPSAPSRVFIWSLGWANG